MRRSVIAFAIGLSLAAAAGAHAQSVEDQLKDRLLGSRSGNGSLSERDAAGGIREALAQGVDRAVRQLGKEDGFFRDQAVKILVPEKLRKLSDLARQLGAGKKVDAFELSMNRAAEKAVPLAAGILADSVRQMTLQDAIGLVRGGETSATDFFRRTSEQKLYDAFLPIVAKQTASVGVTQKYKDFTKKAGGNALAGALLGSDGKGMSGADLDDYVTRRTIDGLFHVIAEQERQIRRNPGSRTTELLRRVFR
ncbi:MAG: DUF4197 domain-containing protein [Pseudomonadota bacterium]